MNLETLLHTENLALSAFVARLGFDPAKVIAEVSDPENSDCKDVALAALRVDRKFSDSSLSQAGIEAANRWLDRIIKSRRN